MDIQVKKSHYFRKKYNSLERFVSYYYQTSLVTDLVDQDSGEILEIGVGNGMTSQYLRNAGFNISTCDVDRNLNPDVVADIRNLPFENNSFDIVTAFEVLEHLPWEDFEKTLLEIKRITNKYAVISLPYRSTGFEIILKFPGVRTLFKQNFLDWFLRIPLKFGGIKTSGQHYWEIDGYNCRLGQVTKILKKHFSGVRKIRPVLDCYRLFFILEK